jgi:hypothetical protein
VVIIALIDSALLLMIISFPPSLFLLGFIFSGYIGTKTSNKIGINRKGLTISFEGLALASVLLLATPLFPHTVPMLDVAIVVAAAAWIVQLRRYCGTGWLETLPQAILPVIAYVVILVVASAFVILFTS